jgi:hypothetical protein
MRFGLKIGPRTADIYQMLQSVPDHERAVG